MTGKQQRQLAIRLLWAGMTLLMLVSVATTYRFLTPPSPNKPVASPPQALPPKATQSPSASIAAERSVESVPPLETLTTLSNPSERQKPPLDQVTETIPPTSTSPNIAIIIDDIGYQLPLGKRSTQLHGDITLAVIPFSPYAEELAKLAHRRGKEVMVHAPMEPEGKDRWRQGLHSDMDEVTMRRELGSMVDSLPTAKGVNNHMGSALTPNGQAMGWIMKELSKRDMYFVDSRTSAKTQALNEAQKAAVLSSKRDIFLDNVRSSAAIQRQFNRLLDKARQQGNAIAIGHPYPETLSFLETALRELPKTGVQLLPVSQILQQMALHQSETPSNKPADLNAQEQPVKVVKTTLRSQDHLEDHALSE